MADKKTQAKSSPKAAPPRTPRKSKATRWRAGVLILVHVLAAIHIAHWMSTGSTVSPLEPSEAMDFAKYSVVNAGLVFFAITILSTMVLGRWFCGWACHVVALQDLSRALLIKLGIRPRPLRSRWMMVMPILAAFYMFLWPLVYRVWVGDSLAVREITLEKSGFWDTFPTWGPAILTFFIAGFLAVYFLGAKGFCTYACPYGAVFGVVDRLSPGRIRVNDDCVQCGHCSLTCSSNVDVSREVHDYGMVVDPGCMKCMDCVSVCPENALSFGMGKPALFAKPRQEKRPARPRLPLVEEAGGTLAFVFGYFAIRGYYQERGFLLSVGLAACFAFMVVTLLRLGRRSDVKLPGLVLKEGGSARPLGLALGAGTLALAACAVPFGIVPEVNTWRAVAAWNELEDARGRWFNQGPAALDADETEAAEAMLEASRTIRARTFEPGIVNTERLMWGELFAGNAEGFDEHLGELVSFGSARVDHWMLYARAQAAQGLPREAEETYWRILGEHPDEVAAAISLCTLLAERGELTAASEVCAKALEAAPDSARLLAQRGLLEANAGSFESAVLDFEAAIAREPHLLLARELLWRTLLETGKPVDAIDVMRAALVQEPDFVGARDQLFRTLMSENRAPEALATLREGLAREGAPMEFRAHIAQVLFSIGDFPGAIEESKGLAADANGDASLLGVAYEVLRQSGATEEAEAILPELQAAMAAAAAAAAAAPPR